VCGDDNVDPGEECDGSDDDACPGECTPGCICRSPVCEGVQTIDFEGPVAGMILSEVFSAGGAGPIVVDGTNASLGAANAAIIFDSSCAGGCSGEDPDLGSPNGTFGGPGVGAGGQMGGLAPNDTALGNLLIVAEDLVGGGDGVVDDPDDQGANQTVTLLLDFSAIGPVTISGITIVDVETTEAPATVEFFDASAVSLGVVGLPQVGDNGVANVALTPVSGVDTMLATFHGSAGIDNIVFECGP